MRRLYLLRGTQGIGKSTFIKKYGLEYNTISLDDLRLLYASPKAKWNTTDERVDYTISQATNRKVFEQLYKLLEYRMQAGETLFVDGTHTYSGAYTQYRKLAKDYGYKLSVIDFNAELLAQGKSDEENLDLLYQQNEERSVIKQVPDEAIVRSYFYAKDNPVSSSLNPVLPSDFWGNELTWRQEDLNASNYKKVLVIGDVHSSSTALNTLLDGNQPKDNPDTMYIFVGDYFDRGIEPEDTMRTLKQIWDLPNVVLLRGNHEKHIDNFLTGNSIRSKSFKDDTLPKLLRSYDSRDLYHLQQHLQPMFIFKLGDKNVMVTHAGLTDDQVLEGLAQTKVDDTIVTDNFTFGTEDESYFVNGVGGFNLDVDRQFEEGINKEAYAKALCNNFIQVHGHRNEFRHGVMDFQQTYNLEQRVEEGGKLGAVLFELTDSGVTVTDKSVKNTVFSMEIAINNLEAPLDQLSPDQIKQGLDNSVKVRANKVHNGLTAYNFSRETFTDGAWDALSLRARGLFVDDAGNVQARGFQKFFKLDENDETTEERVLGRVAYPVKQAVKLNGFLSIVSYVDEPDYQGLLITSKGGDTIYSGIAKQTWKKQLAKSGHTLDELSDWLKEHKDVSVTAEVIDPVRDPHLIEYLDSKVVVLDLITNNYLGTLASDADLQKFSDTFGLETPDFKYLNDESELKQSIDAGKKMTNLEGYVYTDATGYQFKLKTDFYLRRKELRNKLGLYRRGNLKRLATKSSYFYPENYQIMQDLVAQADDKLPTVAGSSYRGNPENVNVITFIKEHHLDI